MTKREKIKTKFWIWLAWKLPRVLVAWCFTRVILYATSGQFSNQVVSELTAMNALKRWEERRLNRPLRLEK